MVELICPYKAAYHGRCCTLLCGVRTPCYFWGRCGGREGGAPTLVDVCSRLGKEERNWEGEKGEGGGGEEREWGWGWVPGIWSPSPGVKKLSMGLAWGVGPVSVSGVVSGVGGAVWGGTWSWGSCSLEGKRIRWKKRRWGGVQCCPMRTDWLGGWGCLWLLS